MAATRLKVRGILFDLGGTLDGDGVHWLDRFYRLYELLHLPATRPQIRDAFDFAERNAANDSAMSEASFDEMVRRHVGWQMEALRLADNANAIQLADNFIAEVHSIPTANEDVLRRLAAAGLSLGVISNGCGNTARLCDDFGFTKHLQLILDSRRVGLSKPDPKFFTYAAERLALSPNDILMVGDSLERDVLPARTIGMHTAWITQQTERNNTADLQVRSVAAVCDCVALKA